MDTAPVTKPLTTSSNFPKLLIGIVVLSLVAGTFTGYLMTNKNKTTASTAATTQTAKAAADDSKTFKDFAEGTIKAKVSPTDPNTYTEGTHVLERTGAVPVALTSSVIDLSEYEGKHVKVYGETQKALKEGWLLDVGRVEEIK